MSKRMSALNQLVDKNKVYNIDEALELVKKTSNVKFDASVEAHIKLGIDPSKSEQQIRGTVSLPHGSGKTKRVAAFVGPNDEQKAKDSGADLICGEAEIKKIKDTGKIDFDIAIASLEMMPKMAMAAKVLGPKGLMPSPKTDTVGADIKKLVEEMKKGKIAYKNDDGANIHQMIGKISFSTAQLKDNYNAFIEAITRAKPSSAKGTYIQAIYLASSMGPSVKVEIA